jgi:periplasmic protein CpxP/Spy
MNNNTKTKTLVTIIVFLLITNIAMLIFFIVSNGPAQKRHGHEQNGMYNSLKNDVGFSKNQLDKYQVLRNEQMGKVKPLFNQVRNAKKDFYGLIYSENVSDSLLKADADSIAEKQKSLDLQMFRYFKDIRNICSAAQIQKFDSTLKKEVARMVGKPGRNSEQHKK